MSEESDRGAARFDERKARCRWHSGKTLGTWVEAVAFVSDQPAVSCGNAGDVLLWDLTTREAVDGIDSYVENDSASEVVKLPADQGFLLGTRRGVIYWFGWCKH